jgi:hypothetical protein
MAVVLGICSATIARADPIRVTSGVLQTGFGPVGGQLTGEELQLTAGGFTIASSLEDVGASVQLAAVPTVASGALVDFSGALHVNDAIGARSGSSVFVAGPFTMLFAASPTRIACSTADSLTQCTGVAPFTFDSILTVTTSDGATSTRHLTGGGTVEGSLFRVGSSEMVAVRYEFAASPTPEPATLSLLTTGALVAAASTWHRRRRWS